VNACGTRIEAHDASLRAMEYLHSGARRMSGEILTALVSWKASKAA
jgi:hypothetical protein